jgi:hypothetical protein
MQFNARIEREEPRLDHRGDLGGVLHVEEQQGRPLPIIINEVHGLGLHIREDGLNGRPERARLHRPVSGLNRNVHFDKKSHRFPLGIWVAGCCMTLFRTIAQRTRACLTDTESFPAFGDFGSKSASSGSVLPYVGHASRMDSDLN